MQKLGNQLQSYSLRSQPKQMSHYRSSFVYGEGPGFTQSKALIFLEMK